jgi:hypothetical protein
MTHATMPLAELERLLAETRWPPTLTQQMISEALESGRKFAHQVMEQSRRDARRDWADLDRLVLR